ncbi:putative pentatricopeptide repeat-containing protein At5g06400, mitochondrial, partial [Carica papaya]|uniref:putative pentatricopeptide repeat-containing protein At5g06400, mitochondrial n=1 Tax=Carica papaya TaxID=3649 RepID=UPI000B8CE12C
ELCRVSMTEDVVKVLYEMQASKIVIENGIFDWVISLMEKKGETDKLEKVKQIQRNCSSHSQRVELPSGDASREEKLHIELNHRQLEPGRQVVPPLRTHSEEEVREICNILWSSTDWESVQEALNKSIIQFTPDLVLEILQKCNMHGNVALRFFSWVDKQAGYRHTTETYNMAIKISGRGKDFKHMRSLFFEMRRRRYLITPDTWTIMIMQYGRTGLTDIALRTFKEMKSSGCNTTGSTYKFLIIVLCGRKHRKVDEAIKIFQEMIRAGHFPDKELLEIYLACLCETGKLSEARSCLDFLMKKVGFTVPLTYSMYIRALCRTRRLTEALSVVNEVESERFRLDQYTYGSLVHRLLQNGQLEEALAKVEAMKQMGINPTVHAYTSLIIYFFREKQIEKALDTFNKMKQDDCKPTVVTYSALIHGYMNMGKVTDAWNIFEAMKVNGTLPDFKTYSMFINCLCKAGKSEAALKLLSEMFDCGIVPSTVNFRTVFYGLNREGKRDLARTVLQKKSALIHRRKFLI